MAIAFRTTKASLGGISSEMQVTQKPWSGQLYFLVASGT